jgi:Icc-related predicted phosphoesterase
MTLCFFVSDIHGNVERYDKLFTEIEREKPTIVFMGGDLLSFEFSANVLLQKFHSAKEQLQQSYPNVFLIMGNDDPKSEEDKFIYGESLGLWHYMNRRKHSINNYQIFGYSYVPPTPFLLKDWERFDVSRFIDVGCVSPLEGYRTVEEPESELRRTTIQEDINVLINNDDISHSVFLFHSPPYQTNLDRANLDGKFVDYAPMDVHIGSIAIKRFIETKQPYITLHGHVHESSTLTGKWSEKVGNTYSFSAAYDKPDLAIIKFYLEQPSTAHRSII